MPDCSVLSSIADFGCVPVVDRDLRSWDRSWLPGRGLRVSTMVPAWPVRGVAGDSSPRPPAPDHGSRFCDRFPCAASYPWSQSSIASRSSTVTFNPASDPSFLVLVSGSRLRFQVSRSEVSQEICLLGSRTPAPTMVPGSSIPDHGLPAPGLSIPGPDYGPPLSRPPTSTPACPPGISPPDPASVRHRRPIAAAPPRPGPP